MPNHFTTTCTQRLSQYSGYLRDITQNLPEVNPHPVKNSLRAYFLAFILLPLGLFSTSCEKDDEDPGDWPTVESHLNFRAVVDGEPVEYDTLMYVNEAGNVFGVETIRYFVSNVALVDLSGERVPVDTAIYVDHRDEAYTRKSYPGAFPNGTYTAVEFTFGLDSAMNRTNAFINFPEAAMEWPVPMGGGYHYMKLEGKYALGEDFNHYNFHTGPLDGNHNYFQVHVPVHFEIADGRFDLTVEMEIQNWFRDPHTFDLSEIDHGMMGNQEKQQQVKENGHDVFSVQIE